MNSTLIVLLIVGIGIYLFLKKKRKKEPRSIDDYVDEGVFEEVKETERLSKELKSDFRNNRYNVHFRKYKYSKINLNTLDYLLEEECIESHSCKNSSSYRIASNTIRLKKVYKLRSSPFTNFTNTANEISTFTYMREIPEDEYFKYRESFDKELGKHENVHINCILGYRKLTLPPPPIEEIFILYFDEISKGEIQEY